MHASKLHIYQYTNVAIWLSSIKINISDPKIGILQAKTFLYVGQKALLDSFVTISVTIGGLVFPWMSQNSRSFSENCTHSTDKQQKVAFQSGRLAQPTENLDHSKSSEQYTTVTGERTHHWTFLSTVIRFLFLELLTAPFVMIWPNEPAASIMGGLLWGMEAGGLKRERFQYSDRKVWRFFFFWEESEKGRELFLNTRGGEWEAFFLLLSFTILEEESWRVGRHLWRRQKSAIPI